MTTRRLAQGFKSRAMRLLSLSLAIAVTGVVGGPPKGDPLPPMPPMPPKMPKDPKGAPLDCDTILGNFRMDRDVCLADLGLSSWILPVETASPVTQAPSLVPTSNPTDAPTGTPSYAPTGSPNGDTPAPTLDAVQTACDVDGDCMMFMTNTAMWRPQIEWCLWDAASEATDPIATQLWNELKWSTDLVNTGCSVNEMDVTCADGPFAALAGGKCPTDQADVDDAVAAFGCCVTDFMMDMMQYDELSGTPGCTGGPFKMPKPCKAPKWKGPKDPPPPAPLGKDKKAGIAAGAIVGGLAGIGAVGLALRRRKAKFATPNRAEKVATAPAVVAV
jgi:hypothetical protein